MEEGFSISVKTDRGEKEIINIEDTDWLSSHVREVESAKNIGNSRRIIIPKSVINPGARGKLFDPYEAVLCVDELNKQWWVEGLDKKEMGSFFISESVALLKKEGI